MLPLIFFIGTLLFSKITSAQLLQGTKKEDWLRLYQPSARYRSQVVEWCQEPNICGLELSNGLMSRKFVLTPAFGTVDWSVQEQGVWRSMFRGVTPEAVLLINGSTEVSVGGLSSRNKVRAYCNRSDFYDSLYFEQGALQYLQHRIFNTTIASYPWRPGTRYSDPTLHWPPLGTRLEVDFTNNHTLVTLAYELYDGVPLMSKQLIPGKNNFFSNISRLDLELAAVLPPYGKYITSGSKLPDADDDGAPSTQGPEPKLHAKTDQAYGADCTWTAENTTAQNAGSVLPLLNCSGVYFFRHGNHSLVSSFKTIVLVMDSMSDLQRMSLGKQRALQTLAPQSTEAPIFFHWAPLNDSYQAFVPVVDQLADAGFEMFIFSFGSGFDLETIANNETALYDLRRKVAYAHSKGIRDVGGYDLIVRDRGHNGYGGNAGDQYAVVDPTTGELTVDACIASDWDSILTNLIFKVIDGANLSVLELDGPYGGASCAATNHTYHTGLEDSIFAQTQKQNILFRQLRARNIYINSPDEYFYQGLNRATAGYSEKQYSLPAWQDITVSRQGMYDDLYDFTPTQGWMFAPLSVYEGGGQAAELDDKPLAFEWALAQYLGAGVAAAYRGPFLYNTSEPKIATAIDAALKRWIPFYKQHRLTLSKPIVHLRRADLQSYDGWLHVHPTSDTPEIGLAMIFNPTERNLTLDIRLPLYYTGIDGCCAMLTLDDHPPLVFVLDRDYSVQISFFAAAFSIHSIIIERPSSSS